MFERFTRETRRGLVDAEDECRRLQGLEINSVHLLLALTRDGHTLAVLLARHGLSHDALDEHASDALTSTGLDATAIRRAWRRHLARGALQRARRGPGHLPFRADARRCLELSAREATRLRSGNVRVEHLALGILCDPGPLLSPILVALGVDVPALRRDLELLLRPAA